MIRLAIAVEGETEEEFVKNVLAGHLRTTGVEPQPIPLGGNITVSKLASAIAKLQWDFDRVTSLVDFYGFRDKGTDTLEQLEQRISRCVDLEVKRSWDQSRVFPYIQRHEFEALLFSEVAAFADVINVPEEAVADLRRIRHRFHTPEDINDSGETAPSKRILGVIPRYKKVVDGSLIAEKMGLNTIRSECPRFNSWLERLESFGTPPPA